MANDEDAEVEAFDYADHIAARVDAHRRLLVDLVRIDDEDLRKEGLAMLRAARLSFKTQPQAEVTAIDGGRR